MDTASFQAPWTPGERFRSVELLGGGSHALVYRAYDRHLDLTVALKRIGDLSANSIVQLKAEFRAVAALSHPNLVSLHELFVEDGVAFFSMELVDGIEFPAGERESRGVDAARVANLAGQLCNALAAIHAAGLVHRDIKPGNILIRPDGGLVLLDFGFARDERAVPATPRVAERLVGTYAYMAPEQFAGAIATTASDMYAVGVLLHEALTGELPAPFLGDVDRNETTALLPRDVPEPLRSLIASLLSIEAAARPSALEVVRVLAGGMAASAGDAAGEPPFVGREQEKLALLHALRSATTGAMIEVLGRSGVGKTEFVRRTLSGLATADTIVLRSRCHRSESVPFQALDAIVDDLGIALLQLQTREPESFLVSDAAAASVLFPSLARLPAVSRPMPGTTGDPIEQRREAVGALRRLLCAVARNHRLIAWIDDAQWADADSIGLLNDISGVAGAPPIRWVLSTRTPNGRSSAFGDAYASLSQNAETPRYQKMQLEPLPPEEATMLVRALAAGRGLSHGAIAEIVRASAGNPMVLASLASLEDEVDEGMMAGGFSFALARTTADLAVGEQRLLELIALSQQPTELSLLFEAAGVGNAGVLAIRKLESRRLVRTAPHGEHVLVDSYHDQVPETLLAAIARERASDGHGRLARAHEKRASDPAVLCHHFHGAGELRVAATWAERAGVQANDTLAFARAAEFFRAARTWDDRAGPERVSGLLQQEAEALANSGSLAAAGERYLECSRYNDGGAALELRRRAIESLLAGGRVDDAIQQLRRLLAELGLSYPRTELSALLGAVGALVRYLLRPGRVTLSTADPLELLRIDTCYSAGRRLADIDPARGSYLLATSLSRSLRSGDPERLVRSLCTAGGALGAVAGRTINRIGDRMMSDARRISEELPVEELAGMIDVAYGEVHMLGGRWSEALTQSRAGVSRLQRKPGYVFECNVGRSVILRALEELGQVCDEHAEGRAFLEDAAAHHNNYAGIRAAQHLTVACLALGRSEEARSYLRVGFDRWMDGAFQMQHLYAARNEALCDLYDGDPEHGMQVLDAIDARYRRSVLRRVPLIRIDMDWLRGQLALAIAAQSRQHSLVREAVRASRKLERERRSDASVRAACLRAGIASCGGEGDCELWLEQVEIGAARLSMDLLAAAAALLRHRLGGNSALRSAANAALVSAGVGDVGRYVSTLVPGRFAGRHER
ncbi:MAG: protein kinase [Candidatus Binatia bacterium]